MQTNSLCDHVGCLLWSDGLSDSDPHSEAALELNGVVAQGSVVVVAWVPADCHAAGRHLGTADRRLRGAGRPI